MEPRLAFAWHSNGETGVLLVESPRCSWCQEHMPQCSKRLCTNLHRSLQSRRTWRWGWGAKWVRKLDFHRIPLPFWLSRKPSTPFTKCVMRWWFLGQLDYNIILQVSKPSVSATATIHWASVVHLLHKIYAFICWTDFYADWIKRLVTSVTVDFYY